MYLFVYGLQRFSGTKRPLVPIIFHIVVANIVLIYDL